MFAGRIAGVIAVAGLAMSVAAQTAVPMTKPPQGLPPIQQQVQPLQGQPLQGLPAPTVKAPAAPSVPAMPGAAIEFEELIHKFGVISDDKEVETKFKFKNTGTAEMQIVNLAGSCGCTVPALEKKTYAPGESGEITVKYNPHNRRGKQNTNITVTTNVPEKATVTLGLESEVKPTVFTEPQVASIGQIERGKEGKATIMITSRKLDLVVTQVTPNDTKVNAKIGEPKEVEIEGEKLFQFPIEVTVSPEAAVGPIQTQCVVRTNDPARTLNFMVLGEVIGQLKTEPQRVTLGGLTPGQEMTTTFRVSPRNDKVFKVLSAVEEPASAAQPGNPQAAPPGLKIFEVSVMGDSTTTPTSWIVTLKGKAPLDGGTFRGDIVLKTDVPGEEVVKVPYYGFIRAKAKPVPGQVSPAGQPANPSMLVPD